MNNKGFISISVIYSFFIVFLLMLLFIIDNLVNDRLLLNNLKDTIKSEIKVEIPEEEEVPEEPDNPPKEPEEPPKEPDIPVDPKPSEDDNLQPLFDYIIKKVYVEDGVNNLYLHDNKYKDEANDGSYRYSGESPKNYICFGSNAGICPEDNLYRIIGVFGNQVKLIKNSSIGTYQWSGSASARSKYWKDSELNTKILNGTFLNSFSEWSDLIDTVLWKGGASYNPSKNPQSYFREEVTEYNEEYSTSGKIGLMYLSDYGFAVSANKWYSSMFYYGNSDIVKTNWLYLEKREWTISNADDYTESFYIRSDGGIDDNSVYSISNEVRPTFYLKASVKYVDGDGSKTSPYRVK